MKTKKYDLKNMAAVFGVSGSAQVLNKIKGGCNAALGITPEEFDANFSRSEIDVIKKVPREDGKKYRGYSSRGKGNSGRQWISHSADALLERWYETRDVEWLYNHPDYFWEGLACSWNTSAPFITMNLILELKYPRIEDKQGSPRTSIPRPIEDYEWNIFDWGAGCGLTTLLLAKNFPRSKVYYNEKNAQQVALFRWLLKESGITNVEIVDDIEELPPLDMLVAIEIVEHFQKPMDAIRPLIQKLKKGGLVAHSSYWEAEMKMPTLGHFLTYDFGGMICDVRKHRDVYNGWRKAMEDEGLDFLNWIPYQKKPRFWMKN